MLASTAPSDRPLILGIDLTQLPDHPSYRVEVVDWRGRSVWESAVEPTDDLISLPLDRSLSRGQYWVRVYDSFELLREFSLRVE